MNLTCLTENRPKSIKQITTVFLIIGLVLSFNLWVRDKQFPMIPCIDGLENIPYFLNYTLFFFLITLLFIELYKSMKWTLVFAFSILFFLLLQDQNRLQPWVYIYILILLPFGFSYFLKISERNLILPIKIIFIAMYFWSGVQKANTNFINQEFSQILANLFKIQDPLLIKNLLPFGYIIPTIEIFIAVCLTTKKSQHLGVFLAILTHFFILIYVSPIGTNDNYIIYPWNIAMILLVVALFYKCEDTVKLSDIINAKTTVLTYFYILLLGMLPMLNFRGNWDDYLSFSLYSQKSKIFYIAISDKYISQLNHRFDDYFLKLDDNIKGGKVINANKWSMETLNVPIYPEIRVFEKISKDFCQYNIPETDMIFLVYNGSISNENLTKWTCNK